MPCRLWSLHLLMPVNCQLTDTAKIRSRKRQKHCCDIVAERDEKAVVLCCSRLDCDTRTTKLHKESLPQELVSC